WAIRIFRLKTYSVRAPCFRSLIRDGEPARDLSQWTGQPTTIRFADESPCSARASSKGELDLSDKGGSPAQQGQIHGYCCFISSKARQAQSQRARRSLRWQSAALSWSF